MFAGQLADEGILRHVRILKFIHQNVAVLVGVALADGGVFLEQADRPQQQVVEVQGVAGTQAAFIFGEHALHNLVAVGAAGKGLRGEELVFGVGNAGVHAGGAVEFVVQVEFFDDGLYQPLLVVGVEDDVIAGEGEEVRFAAQDASADGMERADQHAPGGLAAQQGVNAVLHFAGGFIGERHCQDLGWAEALFQDQPGDAVGQDARLAGAGAGQHQHRPGRGCDGGLLLWVEVFQKQCHGQKRRAQNFPFVPVKAEIGKKGSMAQRAGVNRTLVPGRKCSEGSVSPGWGFPGSNMGRPWSLALPVRRALLPSLAGWRL